MPKRTRVKQASPRRTGLVLRIATGTAFELLEYPFPESREKFNVFVNGARTQSARTSGKGKKGDLRNYTYIKYEGKSMYVSTGLDENALVSVVSAR